MNYLKEPYEILYRPLEWQLAGLQQTASGYGSKLVTSNMIKLPDGRTRRIYVTQWSNAGSAWIILNKTRVYLEG